VASACHANTQKLVAALTANGCVETVFNRPYFHETPLRFSLPLEGVMRSLHAHNILPGFDLSADYPELADTLLVCATETRSDADIALYADHLHRVIDAQTAAGCPVEPKMA
jgi:glycine dehydrogenase subunit 1